METKVCEICGQSLPLSAFSKSYKGRCKECVARLFYEIVNTDRQMNEEWLNNHVIASLDFFFCDAEFRQDIEEHFHDNGFYENYNFPTLVINDIGDYSDDDMLEFKYEYINHKYYLTFLERLKG